MFLFLPKFQDFYIMKQKCSLLTRSNEKERKKEKNEKMAQMATLTEKQANEYLNARPTYPTIWYKVLAGRTSNHKVAWDVGTGNGQAALGVHYLSHLLHMLLLYFFYTYKFITQTKIVFLISKPLPHQFLQNT